MDDTDSSAELSKPQHIACYDSEWTALEKERAKLGLYTRFDVIRHYFRKRGVKGFRPARKLKPGQKLPAAAR